MANEKDQNGLTKTNNTNITTPSKGGIKIGIPRLHQRIAQAQPTGDAEYADVSKFKYRIGLQLDVSGSMGWRYLDLVKLDLLKDAIQGFVSSCDFEETALAIETFPEQLSRPLSNIGGLIVIEAQTLHSGGGTPMDLCMNKTLTKHSITRSVLISDGKSDNDNAALREAKEYSNAEIPIDTVSIGDEGGEELLREIARITGGIFIKFKNIQSFAKNFKYLTPKYRAALASGQIDARTLGADSVVK